MILKAEVKDLHILAELACKLWPNNTVEEMCAEMGELLTKPDTLVIVLNGLSIIIFLENVFIDIPHI